MKPKGKKVLCIAIIGLIVIVGLSFWPPLQKFLLHQCVKNDNYQIIYTFRGTYTGYDKMVVIIEPSGNYTCKMYYSLVEKRVDGHYDKEDLKEFTQFAIDKNITELTY